MKKVRQGAQVNRNTKDHTLYICQTIPATLLARQNPSNVVGADIFPYSIGGAINSHTVRLPHMPLGINSVVGASIYHTRRTW